jgi:hypothetical protein
MSVGCVPPDDLQRFVLNALPFADSDRLQRHVAGCETCARALMTEARAERTLRELWPQVSRPTAPVIPLRPAAHQQRRRAINPGLFGAVAAAMMLMAALRFSPDRARDLTDARAGCPPAEETVCTGAPVHAWALASWNMCAPSSDMLVCRADQLRSTAAPR